MPPLETQEIKVSHSGFVVGQTYSDSYHYGGTFAGACDGNTGTYWDLRYPSFPVWGKISFGLDEAYVVHRMRMYTDVNPLKDYKIQGSLDGTTWVDLLSDQYPSTSGWIERDIDNETAYGHYRIYVISKWGSYGRVRELELFAYVHFGQERAFTVTGQEPLYTKIPSGELGPLIDKTYKVVSVEGVDSNDHDLKLNAKSFKNSEGPLLLTYDMAKGSLSGVGGSVVSFSRNFTPEDLERVMHPFFEEHVCSSIADFHIGITSLFHKVLGDGPYPTTDSRHQAGSYLGDESDPYLSEHIVSSVSDFRIAFNKVGEIQP